MCLQIILKDLKKTTLLSRAVAIHLYHDTIQYTIFSQQFDTIRYNSIHLHDFLKDFKGTVI